MLEASMGFKMDHEVEIFLSLLKTQKPENEILINSTS